MYELFQAMLWPIMVGVLLPPFLIYFGLHLLERRNAFAALAFPQIALLGTTVSTVVHLEQYPFTASLLLTFAAAIATVFFGPSPRRRDLFTAALFLVALPITVALLVHQTESADEATHALYGSLLLVNKRMVLRSFSIGLGSALLAAILLRTLPPGRVREFILYALFSVAICGFLSIGSVLLTFLYTLAPALCSLRLATRTAPRLVLASALAAACTVFTIYTAYRHDLPASPVLGVFFIAALLITILSRRSPSKRPLTEPRP